MSRYSFLSVAIVLLAVGGALAAPDAGRLGVVKGGGYAVRAAKDLTYYDGPDAHPVKHKLDLYLPQGQSKFPVVIFFHGGGWTHGDKDFLFDVYGKLGAVFARNGVGLAVANYRLSPKVKHPEHAKDAARAFAWVKKHIGDYGGDVEQLFVAGHSAGGHLAALLASDGSLLSEHGLNLKDIRGVVGISGVYEISPVKSFFPGAFPIDPEVRRNASPLHHVKKELPPFLLIYGDDDLPTLDRLAQSFHKALRSADVEAELVEVKKRDHFAILGRMLEQEDPALQATLKFLSGHGSLKLEASADGAAK